MAEEVGSQGIVVGVADLGVARSCSGQLITYALGSCIGLSAYDPQAKVGGLLHFMLPQPSEQSDPNTLKPYMYCTTGIPLLIRKVVELGGRQSALILCAAGGAEILEGGASMAVGKRNRTMLRKVLWKVGAALSAEATGGGQARTMSLDLTSGEVRIRSRDLDAALWSPGMRVTTKPSMQP